MPLPSTQDLDARFSVFLNPIRDLTKNWEVDLAKYLEEYLEELAEIQITFDGGETMMNFAEAAMLIQGSAAVYSKKVEFLWQMVLQMLELLSSKRKHTMPEDEAVADAPTVGPNRGAKASQHEETVCFQRLNNLGLGSNITVTGEKENDECYDETDGKQFSFLPATPLYLIEKENEKSKNKVNLYLANHETFGGKDDFHINRSYVTPSGMLCIDCPSELLLGWVVQAPTVNTSVAQEVRFEVDTMLPPLGSPPSRPPSLPPDESFSPELEEEQRLELDLPSVPESVATVVTVVEAPKFEIIEFQRQGLCHKGNLRTEELANAVPIKDPWRPMDPHEQSSPPRPVRAGRLRKPVPCSCHEPLVLKRNTKRKKSETEIDNSKESKLEPIDELLLKQVPTLACNVKLSALQEPSRTAMSEALTDAVLLTDAARAEILKTNLRVPTAACNVANCRRQQEEGDQERCDAEEDCDEIIEDVGAVDEPDLELADPHTGLPDNGFDGGGGGGLSRRHMNESNINDSLNYEPDGEYEALVQHWVAQYVVNAQDHIDSSELTRRVNAWRKRIAPVLALEEDRKAFDIHSYGSCILNQFKNVEDEISFGNIVKGEDRKEVARLFLSSLMLSNTYNVEPSLRSSTASSACSTVDIVGAQPMDCLHLKLLSRTRHHEEMQEYVAPSQHHQLRVDSSLGDRPQGTKPKQRAAARKGRGASRRERNKRPLTPTSSEFESCDTSSISDDDNDLIEASPPAVVLGSPPLSSGSLSPLEAVRVDGIMSGLSSGAQPCTELHCEGMRLCKRPRHALASSDEDL